MNDGPCRYCSLLLNIYLKGTGNTIGVNEVFGIGSHHIIDMVSHLLYNKLRQVFILFVVSVSLHDFISDGLCDLITLIIEQVLLGKERVQ